MAALEVLRRHSEVKGQEATAVPRFCHVTVPKAVVLSHLLLEIVSILSLVVGYEDKTAYLLHFKS